MKTPYLDDEIKFLETGIISFYQSCKLKEYKLIKEKLNTTCNCTLDKSEGYGKA